MSNLNREFLKTKFIIKINKDHRKYLNKKIFFFIYKNLNLQICLFYILMYSKFANKI